MVSGSYVAGESPLDSIFREMYPERYTAVPDNDPAMASVIRDSVTAELWAGVSVDEREKIDARANLAGARSEEAAQGCFLDRPTVRAIRATRRAFRRVVCLIVQPVSRRRARAVPRPRERRSRLRSCRPADRQRSVSPDTGEPGPPPSTRRQGVFV